MHVAVLLTTLRDKRTIVTYQRCSQGVGRDHELENDLEYALRPEYSRHLLHGTHGRQGDTAVEVNFTAL